MRSSLTILGVFRLLARFRRNASFSACNCSGARVSLSLLFFLSLLLGFITSLARRFLVGQKKKTIWVLAFDECTAHERFFWFGWRKVAVVYPDS